MSRRHTSRRAHAETTDDYEDFSRHFPRHREYHVHEPQGAPGSYRSSDNCEPRNIPARKFTVTSYSINTGGESTTSHYDHREYTTYSSHGSSFGFQEFYDENYRGTTLRDLHTLAEGGRSYPSHAHVKHLQPEYLDPEFLNGQSSKVRSHGRDKHRRNDNHSQEKPNNHSSRREEQPYSRSNTRWQEDSRKKENDSYSEDHEQKYHREGLRPSQPKEAKPTFKDGHSSKSRNYHNHRYSTKDKPSQGKPETGNRHHQERPHHGKDEGRRGGIPGSNRKDSSHEVSQPKARKELPDHYAILKLDHLATEAEIKSAAKRRRIEVHPDRLKKPGMSASERAEIDALAAKVGQAADVLLNPEQKLKYDRELYAAKGENWRSGK